MRKFTAVLCLFILSAPLLSAQYMENYSGQGRLKSVNLTESGNSTSIKYAFMYDRSGRLTEIKQTILFYGEETDMSEILIYDSASGKLSQREMQYNGETISLEKTAWKNGRPETIQILNPDGTPVASFQPVWTAEGKKLFQSGFDTGGDFGKSGWRTLEVWSYDSDGRVLTYNYLENGIRLFWNEYAYKQGKEGLVRTIIRYGAEEPITEIYQYDKSGRLTLRTETFSGTRKTTEFTYDNNGLLTGFATKDEKGVLLKEGQLIWEKGMMEKEKLDELLPSFF